MGPATPFDLPLVRPLRQGSPHLGCVTDETPTASLAASLQEAEARFRMLMASARDGMLLLGPDGCRYANPAFCRMVGRDAEDLRGLDMAEIFATDPAAGRLLHRGSRAVVLRGEAPRFATGITTRSGRRLDVVVSMQPLPEDGDRLVHASFRDITTTRRAYELTVHTLSELTQVLDTAQEALCIVRPDRRIQHANRVLAEWVGRPLERVLHRSCDEVLGCAGCDPDDCPLEAVRQGAASVEREVELSGGGGAHRPCLLRAVPYLSPGGRLLGVIASYQDITDRKRIESRERHFRVLFEESAQVLALLDADGTVRALNQAAAAFLGAEAATAASGRFVWETAFSGENRAAARRLRAGVMETRRGRTARFELAVPRTGAPEAHLDISIKPVPGAPGEGATPLILEARDISDRKALEEGLHRERRELEAIVGERTRHLTAANERLVREVRQRKRAEETVRSREEHLRQFYDIDLVGFFVIGEEHRLVDCSEGFAAMLGTTRGALRGQVWFDLLSPESAESACKRVDALAEGETRGYEDERQFRRADGTLIVGSIAIRPVFDAAGSLRQVVGIVLDITDRKRQEQALRQAKLALERSNTDLAAFTYAVSHDLQAPLRKIIAFGDRIRATAGDALAGDAADGLERMTGAAARMQEQIRALLALSRVTREDAPHEEVDLNEVVREALGSLEVAIDETGAVVETGPLPVVLGHRAQLLQLMQNLIGNAIKFHAPGTTPEVRILSMPLSPAVAAEEGLPLGFACAISVSDNGIGIPPGEQGRIFEIFQRLHEPTAYPGTGVGLALCWKVVRAHGGRILVESTPGRGSSFRVLLPLRHSMTDEDASA